jgi:hypothetical protein
MKYIFVAGAPGSKWSSVVKNIYYSPNIDHSDYSDSRTYYHDASGQQELMHLGAYFDPGMESALPEDINNHSREDLEAIFDKEFSGSGIRIIKSHIFSNQVDFIKKTWPDCPLILVHRSDDACLGWWVKCGHFDITYPSYAEYYKNLRTMAGIIRQQNQGITDAVWNYKHQGLKEVTTNLELCDALNIAWPNSNHKQNYTNNDIKVTVI